MLKPNDKIKLLLLLSFGLASISFFYIYLVQQPYQQYRALLAKHQRLIEHLHKRKQQLRRFEKLQMELTHLPKIDDDTSIQRLMRAAKRLDIDSIKFQPHDDNIDMILRGEAMQPLKWLADWDSATHSMYRLVSFDCSSDSHGFTTLHVSAQRTTTS